LQDVFKGIFNNVVLWQALAAWFTAQVCKVVLILITKKKLDFKRFVGSGGMPSSHSALVMGLTTSVGQHYGWSAPMTAITLVMALIVMYDAAGVRRSAGKQAEILNIIIQEILEDHQLKEERLKELIGHSPKEVFIGGLLGIAVVIILS
jgi:hypothetical protein